MDGPPGRDACEDKHTGREARVGILLGKKDQK